MHVVEFLAMGSGIGQSIVIETEWDERVANLHVQI
jgi:hypothetical protein